MIVNKPRVNARTETARVSRVVIPFGEERCISPNCKRILEKTLVKLVKSLATAGQPSESLRRPALRKHHQPLMSVKRVRMACLRCLFRVVRLDSIRRIANSETPDYVSVFPHHHLSAVKLPPLYSLSRSRLYVHKCDKNRKQASHGRSWFRVE